MTPPVTADTAMSGACTALEEKKCRNEREVVVE